MKASENAIRVIKRFEGMREEAYLCPAGVWTIGFGHTAGVKKGDKIDMYTATVYLQDDIRKFEDAIDKLVKVKLNQNQFDALVSFVFNVGAGAFEKSTMLKLINSGNFSLAANEFDKWVYSKGTKLEGLINRRKAEKELFLALNT